MWNKKVLRLFQSPGLAVLCSGMLIASVSVRAQEREKVDTAGNVLEEFVVTGQYQPQSLRNSVYKMNTIGQKRIQAKAANNAQQILSNELGIRFNNDMALGTADISLMGMSGRNVKILMDGVPMLDRGDVRESLNQINAAQIERIEIIEGPMSTIYGSDAQAGVINIITKKPAERSLHFNAIINEESAGREYDPGHGKGLHMQQLSGAWDNGKMSVLASLMHYDFGGWGADEYNRMHVWKPKHQLMPSLRLGYRGKSWDLIYRNDYLLETITEKSEVNLGKRLANNKFYTTDRMAQQLLFNKSWENKFFWNNSLGYTDYSRTTKTDILNYGERTITPGQGPGDQDTATFLAFNLRSSVLYVLNKKLSIQPGVEVNYDKAKGQRIEGEPEITNIAGFITGEYRPFERLNFRPGLRFNYNSLYASPPVIPSLNTLYHIDKNWSIRASYAEGFRTPALRELYFVFKDTNHDIVGNKDLKAERSQNVSLSVAYQKPLESDRMYSTELGYFYNNFNNRIDLILNTDEPGGQQFIMANIDKYKTSGISINNRFATPKLEWRLGAMLLGQFNELSQEVGLGESVSIFNWASEVNVECMYLVQATNTRLNFFYKYTSPRSQPSKVDDQIVIGRTGSFHIADVNVQQQIIPELRLTLGVRNLFNVTSVNNTTIMGGAHSSGGGLLPMSYGRSVFATLSYDLNKTLK